MTINQIIEALSGYGAFILIAFVAIPAIAYGYGKIVGKDKAIQSPHKYVYSGLIYLSCVPGMFALVLCLYAIFILRSSILDVNIAVYFAPIISMVASIIIIRKNVDLNYIPGFDRLYGLFIVLGVSFTIALMILQTRIFIVFGSSITTLIIFVVILVAVLQWGMDKITGKKPDEN
jgi:hypothetical protein